MVNTGPLDRLLCSLGMIPHDDDSLLSVMSSCSWFSVLLDGRVIGQVPAELAESFVTTLRRLKVTASEGVSLYTAFRKSNFVNKDCFLLLLGQLSPSTKSYFNSNKI